MAKIVFESEPVGDDFDIEDVLVPQERTSETKKAKKFLLETLKDRPVLTKEIRSAARDEGLSWATVRRAIRRANRKLNIKAVKENKPGGRWFWELNEFTRRQALIDSDSGRL